MIGPGLTFLAIGAGSLGGALFFAFDPDRLSTRLATTLSGISAALANRYWIGRERYLRWLFAFILGVIGVGFLVGGVVILAGHGSQ